MAELFWPGIADTLETMTDRAVADLVQDKALLEQLMTFAGPILIQAIEQGLIGEDIILQFLTMLK